MNLIPFLVAGIVPGLMSFQLVAAEYEAVLDWSDITIVSIPVDGMVTQVHVSVGQTVKQKQPLLQLSSKSPQYKLNKAKATVAELKPALQDAIREKNDAESLFEQTVLSEVELQAALLNYDQLVAKLKQAEAERDLAQWEMSWTRVRAESDSRVIAVMVKPGQVIVGDNRAMPLMKLASTTAMQAVLAVPADQLAGISTGENVAVSVGNQRYEGTLKAMQQIANSARYQLSVAFAVKDARLAAGMKASVQLP